MSRGGSRRQHLSDCVKEGETWYCVPACAIAVRKRSRGVPYQTVGDLATLVQAANAPQFAMGSPADIAELGAALDARGLGQGPGAWNPLPGAATPPPATAPPPGLPSPALHAQLNELGQVGELYRSTVVRFAHGSANRGAVDELENRMAEIIEAIHEMLPLPSCPTCGQDSTTARQHASREQLARVAPVVPRQPACSGKAWVPRTKPLHTTQGPDARGYYTTCRLEANHPGACIA